MLDNVGSEKSPVSLSKSNLYWEIVNIVNIMTRFIDHKKKLRKEVKRVGKYKNKILYPQYRSIFVKRRDNNDSHFQKVLEKSVVSVVLFLFASMKALKKWWKLHFTLREKCPNTELSVIHILLYSDWIQEITDQK